MCTQIMNATSYKEHESYLENNPYLVSLARFPHDVSLSSSPCITSSVTFQ